MIINFQFENSAMLSSVSYDTNDNEMTVLFNSGRSYIYEDVDRAIYENLTAAKSAGAYFNSIKKDLKVKK